VAGCGIGGSVQLQTNGQAMGDHYLHCAAYCWWWSVCHIAL